MLGETTQRAPLEIGNRAELSAFPLQVRAGLRRLPLVASLAGIVACSAAVRFAIALKTPAPWVMPDELIYSELARSFAATGHFFVRGEPFTVWTYGPLYPIVLAPAYALFASLSQAYLAAMALNCLLFSTAAVPAYLLAKPLLAQKRALLLAALAVLVPSGIYTTKIMTEGLSYPVFLWTMVAINAALTTPTLRRQLVALLALALAFACRGQLAVLFPAYLASIFIVSITAPGAEPNGKRLPQYAARFRATWLILGSCVVLGVAALLARGASPRALLGAHTVLLDRIHPLRAPLALVYHLAELELYASLIPALAFVIVVTRALRRNGAPQPLRAFAASSVAVILALLLLVAVYATQEQDPKIFDRYLFYAVPLIFTGFLVWIRQGLPRPRWAVALAVGGFLLPFALPFSQLLIGRLWGVSSSTVGLVPLGIIRLLTDTAASAYPVLVLGGAFLVWVFLYALTARRAVLVLLAVLATGNFAASIGNIGVANSARKVGIGPGYERGWVDSAVGRDANVVAIWSGVAARSEDDWHTIWQNEFFNRSVRRVYDLAEPLRYGLPETPLRKHGKALFLPTGHALRAEYVLTDLNAAVVGQVVAVDRATAMAVYRTSGPVRLR